MKERSPSLLYFGQWAYGGNTNLHVVGVPAGTPPVQSQCGVRQGDPLGPLLFALAMQGPRQRACDVAQENRMLAYLDDVHLVGKPDQVRLAFHALQAPPRRCRARLVCARAQVCNNRQILRSRSCACGEAHRMA